MMYRADIDGLRTLAVLLVLVFHFDLFALGKAGFIGVDIFFVISGFLITTIIRKDLERGQFCIGEFFYRRVRRLYPALLFTLLTTLAAGYFLFLPYRFEELARQTLLSLIYIVNFYFWTNINYFGLQAGSVPLLHMWSLAIEEQFYILFPLFCAVVWRLKPKLLTPMVIAGMLGSFALALTFAPYKPELAFYLLPTRAWELLVGSVLALIAYGRTIDGRWLYMLGPAGLILVSASVVLYEPLTQVPGIFSLLPTLGAVVLILGGYATNAPVTRLFSSSLMVWIGKISYPLYLVHWPILILMKEHIAEFSLPYRFGGFVFSFVAATLIFYGVEMPVRERKVLGNRRRYIIVVSTMSLGRVDKRDSHSPRLLIQDCF